MFTHSFHKHQIILLCYRGCGLLEGFYIQQRRDTELTPCQRELKFDVLPVTPPCYVTRLYVCRKKSLTSLSDRQQYSVGQICSTKHNTRFRSLLTQTNSKTQKKQQTHICTLRNNGKHKHTAILHRHPTVSIKDSFIDLRIYE